MRTRFEIEKDLTNQVMRLQSDGPRSEVYQEMTLEVLFDCRDLLQKLVENTNMVNAERIYNKTKQIVMEVPFTEKENELFNGLDKLDV